MLFNFQTTMVIERNSVAIRTIAYLPKVCEKSGFEIQYATVQRSGVFDPWNNMPMLAGEWGDTRALETTVSSRSGGHAMRSNIARERMLVEGTGFMESLGAEAKLILSR